MLAKIPVTLTTIHPLNNSYNSMVFALSEELGHPSTREALPCRDLPSAMVSSFGYDYAG
jgi:hypothetical protein